MEEEYKPVDRFFSFLLTEEMSTQDTQKDTAIMKRTDLLGKSLEEF